MGEGGSTHIEASKNLSKGAIKVLAGQNDAAITEVTEAAEDDSEEVVAKYEDEQKKLNSNELLAIIESRLKETPYWSSIEKLAELRSIYCPIDKARCIVTMSSLIVQSVNRFWEGIQVNEDHLTIAADSLIMVYIYVIVKSRIIDIFAQIKFINEFLTPYVKNTKIGYCVTTMEVAVSHINMLSADELLIGG